MRDMCASATLSCVRSAPARMYVPVMFFVCIYVPYVRATELMVIFVQRCLCCLCSAAVRRCVLVCV